MIKKFEIAFALADFFCRLAASKRAVDAVSDAGVVCQIGTQIHAGENYRRVVEKIQAGHIGDVSVARTFNVMNQGPAGIGKVTDTTVPDVVGQTQAQAASTIAAAPISPHCRQSPDSRFTPVGSCCASRGDSCRRYIRPLSPPRCRPAAAASTSRSRPA